MQTYNFPVEFYKSCSWNNLQTASAFLFNYSQILFFSQQVQTYNFPVQFYKSLSSNNLQTASANIFNYSQILFFSSVFLLAGANLQFPCWILQKPIWKNLQTATAIIFNYSQILVSFLVSLLARAPLNFKKIYVICKHLEQISLFQQPKCRSLSTFCPKLYWKGALFSSVCKISTRKTLNLGLLKSDFYCNFSLTKDS